MKVFNTISKKLLVYLLALAMLLTIAPMAVLAADADEIPAGGVTETALAENHTSAQEEMQAADAAEQTVALQEDETTYTVTFHLGVGGDIATFAGVPETLTVSYPEGKYIDQSEAVPDVTNSYYEFAGWSDSENSDWSDTYDVWGDMDLYAVWAIGADVSFDANGGFYWDYDTGAQSEYGSQHFEPSTYPQYLYMDDATNDNPGFTFDGWYDENGKKYESGDAVAGEIHLTARWKEPDTLQVGKTETVSNQYEKWYTFTPAETAVYSLEDFSTSGCDLYSTTLEDDSLSTLTSWYDDCYERDAAIPYPLIAGQKYYYRITLNGMDDDCSCSFKLQKAEIPTLSTDEPSYIDSSENGNWWKFTVPESAGYKIATPFSSHENCFILYDSNMNRIAVGDTAYFYDEDTGDELSRQILSVLLEKDACYYLELYGFDSTLFCGTISVEKTSLATVTYHVNNDNAWYEGDWNEDLEDNEHLSETTEVFAEGDAVSSWSHVPYSDYEKHISFAGWSTDPKATEPDEEIIASDGLDLYAVWKQQYQVTFHINNSNIYFEGDWDEEADDYIHASETTRWISEGTVLYWHSEEDSQCFDSLDYYTEGHIYLKGWTTDKNDTSLNKDVYVTGDMDVWAVLGEEHKVTFNTNRDDVSYINDEWDPEAEEYISVSSKTYESWYPEGRTFDRWYNTYFEYDYSELEFLGWSTDPNATKPDDETKVGKTDLILYAVWRERYTVTFDANGGYYDDEEEEEPGITYRTYASGDTFYPLSVYTDEVKKAFAGWFDAKTGGKQYTKDTKITKSVTLYARWVDAKEEKITAGTLTKASADNSKMIYSFTPAEDGFYLFNTADGKNYYPSVNVYDKDMNRMEPVVRTQTDYSNCVLITELKKGTTYYYVLENDKEGAFSYNVKIAKVPSVTVTFDVNRAGETVNGKTTVTTQFPQGYYIEPDAQGLDISRNGTYRLYGWSRNRDAEETADRFEVTKDTTLYGIWKDSVTVTFDANGGGFPDDESGEYTLPSVSETYFAGDIIEIGDVSRPQIPDSDIYFAGWATTKDATEAQNEIPVTSDLTTVYAVWKTGEQSTFEDAIDLTLDKEMTVRSNSGAGIYYRFVPSVTGVYEFYSYDNDGDPFAELYDADGRFITEDDEGREIGNNFSLSYSLTKGETYYYLARAFGDSSQPFSYKVKLTKPVSTEVTFLVNRNDGLASFDGEKEYTQSYTVGKRLSSYSHTPDYNENSGIIFAGWSTDPKAAEADEEIIVTENMKLYAVWKKSVQVTLDTNGASLDDAYFWVWNPETYEDIKAASTVANFAEGADIGRYDREPNIRNSLKYFAGWSTKKTATEPDSEITAKEGLKLYAVWKDLVNVTFDANGGYFNDAGILAISRQIKGDALESYRYPINFDETLVFAGWATTANATEPNVEIGETPVNTDTTLYAVWKKGIKVTVHANGGYYYYDGAKQDFATFYVLSGTTLRDIMYYTAVNADEHKVDHGQRAATANGAALDMTTKITKETDLYVLWTDRVKVTYDANGGTIYGQETDIAWWNKGVEQGISPAIQAKPSDENKAFAGWSTKKDGSAIVSRLKPTSDITLYAVYKDGVKVTIASANEKIGYAEATVNGTQYRSYGSATFLWAEGTTAGEKMLSTVLRGDYEYIGLGFSTTKEESGLIDDSYVPTKDTTLYAIFVPGYHIGFNAYPGYYTETHFDGIDAWRTNAVRKGQAVGYVEEPHAPAGLQFIGWKNVEDSDAAILSSAEVAKIVPTKSMSFRAQYADPTALKEVSQLAVTVSNATYTGKALTPAVTVKDGTKTLKAGTDYTVAYSNNTNVGTKAVATITGKGLYTGSVKKTFSIAKAKQPMTVKAKAVKLTAKNLKKKAQKVKAAKSMTIANAQGTKTFQLKSVAKAKFKKYFTVNKKNGQITVKKGLKKGTYKLKITVTAAGNANYLKGAKDVTVTVKVK